MIKSGFDLSNKDLNFLAINDVRGLSLNSFLEARLVLRKSIDTSISLRSIYS